jgi:hypothetical protein
LRKVLLQLTGGAIMPGSARAQGGVPLRCSPELYLLDLLSERLNAAFQLEALLFQEAPFTGPLLQLFPEFRVGDLD